MISPIPGALQDHSIGLKDISCPPFSPQCFVFIAGLEWHGTCGTERDPNGCNMDLGTYPKASKGVT